LVATLLHTPTAPYVLLQKALVEVGLAAVAALVHRTRCSMDALHVRLEDLLHLEYLIAMGAVAAKG